MENQSVNEKIEELKQKLALLGMFKHNWFVSIYGLNCKIYI